MGSNVELGIRISADGSQVGAEAARTVKSVASIGAEVRTVNQSVDALVGSISRMGHVAAAAFSGREIVQTADAWQSLNAQLAIATGSLSRGAEAYTAVLGIARQSGQSLEQVGTVYRRFAENANALGLSQQNVAAVSQTVAQAMALSGGSAASAQAALIQFGQALASGVLRGEELNSVLEQAPRLARALADGLGVPVGKLRELAEAGQITSEAIVGALSGQARRVADEFGALPMTVGRALENIRTAWVDTVGSFEKSSGAFASLAQGLNAVASHLGGVVAVAGTLAAVLAGRSAGALVGFIGQQVAAAQAGRQLALSQLDVARSAVAAAQAQAAAGGVMGATTVSTVALANATRGLAVAQGAVAATRPLAVGLAALGGPVGLLTMAVLAGGAAWATWGGKAEAATADAARSAAQNLDSVIDKLREMNARLEQTTRTAYQGTVTAAESELKSTRARIGQLDSELGALDDKGGRGRFSDAGRAKQTELNALVERETQLQAQLAEARRRSGEVGTAALQKFLDAHAVGTDKVRVDQQKVLADFAASIRDTGGVFDAANPAHAAALRGLNAKLAEIRSKGSPKGGAGGNPYEVEQEAAKAWAKTLQALAATTDQVASKTAGWSKAQREINALVGSSDWQALTTAQKELALAAYDRARAAEEAAAAEAAGAAALADYRKAVEAIDRNADSLFERAEALRFETETMGMTQSAVYALLAARKEEAAERNAYANDNDERVAALRREAAAYREMASAALGNESRSAVRDAAAAGKEAHRQAAEEAAKRWQSFNDELSRGLTDAIFDGGKSGLDLIEGYARTMVLKPLVQMVMEPTVGAVGQGLGLAPSGGGFPGIPGGGSSMFTSFATSSLGQSLGLSESMAGFAFSDGASMAAAGAQLTGVGSAISTALPYVGAALAVASLLSKDDPDAMRTGNFRAGIGGTDADLQGNNWAIDQTQWFSGTEMNASLLAFQQEVAAQERRLIKNLGIYGDKAIAVSAALMANADKRYEFGMEHTDWRASNADEQIVADRLQIIAQTLGLSIEEVTAAMSESAESLTEKAAKLKAAQAGDLLKGIGATLRDLDSVSGLGAALASARGTIFGTNTPDAQIADLRRRMAEADGIADQVAAAAAIKDLVLERYAAEKAAIEQTRDAARSAQAALRQALAGVGDYARGLGLSALSPLTNLQRLDTARGQFGELLGSARGGNVDAVGKLAGAADAYLSSARTYYASSPAYSAIFSAVQGDLAALGLSAGAVTDTQDWQAQLLEVQRRAADDLTDLQLQTDTWTNTLETALTQQATEFAALKLSQQEVADNTRDLDARIGAVVSAAVALSFDKLATAIAASDVRTARAFREAVAAVERN